MGSRTVYICDMCKAESNSRETVQFRANIKFRVHKTWLDDFYSHFEDGGGKDWPVGAEPVDDEKPTHLSHSWVEACSVECFKKWQDGVAALISPMVREPESQHKKEA